MSSEEEVKKAEIQEAMALVELQETVKALMGGGGERKRLYEILNGSMKCVLAGVKECSSPPTRGEVETALKAISVMAPIEFRARQADVAQKTLELQRERLEFDRRCREEDQAEMRRKNEVGGTAGERALEVLRAAGLFKQGLDAEAVAEIEGKIRRGE